MTTDEARSPYVAKFLSLLAPGLGHVYTGRIVPGLAFSGGAVAVGMLGTTASVLGSSSTHTALLVAAGCWLGLWFIAAIDAFRGARRGRGPLSAPLPARPAPSEYDRWYVYAVLAALTLASAASWALAVRERVAQVFHVPSVSMEPTISKGSHVLANELAYRKGPVRRGDVVVFVNPNERSQRYVKRVVALPGETVEMRGGDLLVDGVMLPHESDPSLPGGDGALETNGGARYRIRLVPPDGSGAATPLPATKVPNGQCFVLGDNRSHSIDSRNVGPVPLADIVGRVDHVW
jgi:signal peptidase I